MAVPLLDMKRQYDTIKDQVDSAVAKVLNHGWFILGPEVKELEKKIAGMCGVSSGVGVACGTDALLLSLDAAGVGPGDEVIVPDYSFFASAGVVSRLGARPVFVDIEADTYNIDPTKIKDAITSKTKAIMPVHLFGQIADMDPIMAIAKEHNLAVVEDAAQAIGSTYKNQQAGSIGDFGCFSFYPTKNLGAVGDAGMIVTNNADYTEKLLMLRMHGWKKKYFPEIIGYNSRLDSIQAAVLLVKLDYLKAWTEKRQEHADVYNKAFANTAIVTPAVKDYSYHIYNQYTIAVGNRDELMATLIDKKIGHDIYYPAPFHKLECYRELEYKDGDLPISEKAAESVVSIPIYPELTQAEQDEVIKAVKSVSA
ncbi:MAG: DegT/DnrJ/EryC1/StrS family aminotransferase [candidate division Zixibacteria bacterium]|nr:DegT/DnrJ/EryC1/StrS family aminotransferase [candidate division Zixibacteria bacterium]